MTINYLSPFVTQHVCAEFNPAMRTLKKKKSRLGCVGAALWFQARSSCCWQKKRKKKSETSEQSSAPLGFPAGTGARATRAGLEEVKARETRAKRRQLAYLLRDASRQAHQTRRRQNVRRGRAKAAHFWRECFLRRCDAQCEPCPARPRPRPLSFT